MARPMKDPGTSRRRGRKGTAGPATLVVERVQTGDGKRPFGDESLRTIAEPKKIHGLDLDATASHRMTDVEGAL